jgi:2-keto-4-pentenoate hydratase
MKPFKEIKYSMIFLSTLILWFIFHPSLIQAQDLGTKLADEYLRKTYITEVDPNMTMDQAVKVQEQFVARLIKELGEPVGYKAGLTNAAIQRIAGVAHPIRGTLLKRMLIESGATLQADKRLQIEGGLILRVGSDAINQTKTREQALKFIDAAMPFIELPFIPKPGMKVPEIVAFNVFARYGVVGKPIPFTASEEWMNRLKNFRVQLFEKNYLLSDGTGSALLDNPLNVVLWIKDSLAAEGKKLEAGDLLSLGSITKTLSTHPGSTLRAMYIGLDPTGTIEMGVNFR